MMAKGKGDDRPELISSVGDASARAFLTLAWRSTAPDYRVELVELEESVAARFQQYCQQASADLSERSLIPYDPEWLLRDHEFFALAEDEFPSTDLFDQLNDFQNLNTFKRKDLTKPRLYSVVIQSAQGLAFFGRRMAYLQVLRQKPGLFAAVWDGSTFNALEDSVATFSPQFDWIVWRDSLYVLDANGFHAEFRDGAALRAAVAGHVDDIMQHVGIINSDAMKARCQSSVPMASKLRRISERGLHLTSTPAELKQYALDFDIPIKWQGDELVFEGSLESQWNILKLLDEDRTEGPVSHRHYESAAKREI